MSAAGLDISDRSIRFAELKRGEGGLVLGKFGEHSIPHGLVVQGLIKKGDELKDILTNLGREYGFSFVCISLPEQQGYSLKIEIPKVLPHEIRESIELQLGDYVPIAPHEAVFDYQVSSCKNGEKEKKYDVGLSVMPLNIVSSYLSLFEGTGLMPLSFEFEAHAIARAVIRSDDCGTFLLLDIGATRTGLAVQSRGIITFTSTINVGGYSLTDSVARSLAISFQEAERQKESRGLLGGKEDALYQSLITRLSVLRDEIRKNYDYALSHENIIEDKERGVDRIILCGGETNVPGLANYLAATLNTDVEIANPWVNVNPLHHYVPEIPSNHALRYATAIGLALATAE